MRRSDREVSDPAFFKDVFEKSSIITVAFKDGDLPYCVPLNFVALGDALYFHCTHEGHKLDCMARDPRVHFNTCDELEVNAEKATIYYRSVSGYGLAERVEDEALKMEVLSALLKKYCHYSEIPPFKKPEKTLVVKIAVTSLTGKQHARPA